MKIYIHTDLEGISGIDSIDMVKDGDPSRGKAIELLMGDVNAAVNGAFAGGASHVTVLDSHGGGGNFDMGLLDRRADFDTRENKRWWGKLDSSYAGTFFIGGHAMAGTLNGFLDHTQSSEAWFNYTANGRRMGELGQWAMVAAHFGVPLLLVTGDEAACAEARDFFDPVETASVKRGIGRNKASILPPAEARADIRAAAARALRLVGAARPFAPALPLELRLELQRSDYCDEMATHEGVERIDARTVRKTAPTYLDILF